MIGLVAAGLAVSAGPSGTAIRAQRVSATLAAGTAGGDASQVDVTGSNSAQEAGTALAATGDQGAAGGQSAADQVSAASELGVRTAGRPVTVGLANVLVTSSSVSKPLPARMKDTGGGSQLITAVVTGTSNQGRDGTLTWWQHKSTGWVKVGSIAARFGAKGLSDDRLEGDDTSPTGVFDLPVAFGIDKKPTGAKIKWHHVDSHSWWDENSLDSHYNTWYENCPAKICWETSTKAAHSSEHLANYHPQYTYAVFIGFNDAKKKVRPPLRPSGSGIFLHVSGSGYTAGCVSVKQSAMVAILKWLDPKKSPHIAIGNEKSILGF